MSISQKNQKNPTSFWSKYGQHILFLLIMGLTFYLGFRLGEIKQENNTKINLVVNDLKNANPRAEKINTMATALQRQGVDLKLSSEEAIKDSTPKEDCLFVASRKSHKFHTADCKYGKNIKPTNKVCFKNKKEAKNKGYIPAKGCLGDKK